jgi:magnesium transporter
MEIKKSDILLDTVMRLSRRGAHSHIRRLLLKSHPSEVAGVIRQMTDHEGVGLLEQIRNSDVEAKTFSELGGPYLKTYFSLHDDKQHIAEILQRLPEDEAAALLSDLSEDTVKEIMGLMQTTVQAEVSEILEYEEGTCGRIMAVNVLALNQNLTAREAIDAIQRASTPESLFYIYVIDDYENLVGVISLRQLLQRDKNLKLTDIMIRDVVKVTAYQSQEEAAHYIEEYNFVCLPVVNEEGKLAGMVTVDDIIDFIRDEAQDDVLHMAGVEEEAIDDFSYLRAFTSRGFWYFLLLAGGLLSSELILHFFPHFPEEIYLISFGPLALRLGGSIATQTSTFFHQSILNDDIEHGRATRALWAQNWVTIVVAVFLSLCALLYTKLRFPNRMQASIGTALGLLAVTSFSLFIGLAVPYLADKLKLNSLKVSSRFFHFTMDALSLWIFFYFVWRWHHYV